MRGYSPFVACFLLAVLLPTVAVGYSLSVSGFAHESGLPVPVPGPLGTSAAWVILVHGFNPTTVPANTVWYYGEDMYAQLIHAGYHVAVVSYYGEFTISLSTGHLFVDPTFFGTTDTPIESIGLELGKALSYTFGATNVNMDVVAHSMGGLVTLYMLEHSHIGNVHLRNLVFIGSPMGGAPITALSSYDNMSGLQAMEMESGSPFLTTLKSDLPIAKSNYPAAEWLVYAGDANPPFGNAYFGGPNDGLVSVSSDISLGYSYEYLFADLHIPSLEIYYPGHVSYFEDPLLFSELLKNLSGNY